MRHNSLQLYPVTIFLSLASNIPAVCLHVTLLNLGDQLLWTRDTFLVFTSKTTTSSCVFHTGATENQNKARIFPFICWACFSDKSQNRRSRWQQV